jgi:hypothetical protein
MAMANESQTPPALYWEKVERARRMSPEERMLEGVRMFDRAPAVAEDRRFQFDGRMTGDYTFGK